MSGASECRRVDALSFMRGQRRRRRPLAFVPPGSPLDGGPSVVTLAEQTRRNNMATFPDFHALDEVPRFGVSVGLGARSCGCREA